MSKPCVLGIDLGGGSVRCLLLNRNTGETTRAVRTWEFPVAEDSFGLGFDLDLEDMWQLIGEASRETIANAKVNPADIGSIAVSAMRFGGVILDKKGSVLFAIPNRDARAAGECFEIAEQCGEALNQETGLWPMPIHMTARMKWLQTHKPEVLKNADCLLSMSDWVNYKLCGVKAMDYSQAGCTALFNLNNREWNISRIKELGFPDNIYPEVKESGSKLGTVNKDAAVHLGLNEDIVVGMGGGDSQCSLLGAAAINVGDVTAVAGTTAPVMAICDKATIDKEGRTWSGHHVVPGQWVLESSGGPMGETLSFMARILFPDSPQPELRVFAEAAQSDYGSQGMLSNLGAEVMNSRAPTMPAGQITLTHMSCTDDANPRRHLCRSLVEGYASAIRANIEQISEVTEHKYRDIFLTGGFSRSKVFTQILADLNNNSVITANSEMTSAMGAALCASVAEGVYKNFADACKALVTERNVTSINAEKNKAAQKVYNDWIAMRDAGKDTTAPQVFSQVLPYVLEAGGETVKKEIVTHKKLNALVAAAFDEASLNKMREHMDVEYANFREVKRVLTGPAMVDALQDKQVLVTEVDIVDAKALAKLPDLRVVAACRGNAVNVDVDACTAFGIPVLFAPGRNSVAVADLTVAFILSLARKLVDASQFLKDESVTAGNMGKMGQAFNQLQGHELWQKTIGLVGLGAVGRMVAQRLQGFGARIIAADPFATAEQAALSDVELVSLEVLLQESDFVSLHAAVTPETTGMIGKKEFALMKQGAFFVNTARAALVDEAALIDAVTSERIAGAGLDTFNEEPPGFDHPLVQHPNVLSTPHSAGNTYEVASHQGEDISNALLQLLHGEKPRACLNPEVLENFSWEGNKPTLSDAEIETLTSKPGPAVTDLDKEKQAKGESETLVEITEGDITAPPALIETFSNILNKFCADMCKDEAVMKLSAGQEVTLAFTVHDMGLQMFITMDDGEVRAGLEAAADGGDVQLGTRSEYLHGMLSGEQDAMDSVMNGFISFAGDAGKGMALQQIDEDMRRIYNAVTDELGDPGDLSSIPHPGGATLIEAPAIVGETDIRVELLNTVNELYAENIITATGGNVSVRNPDRPEEELWITPSQVFKGDLTPELMVRIDYDGKALDPGAKAPSSEKSFHTKILKAKPEANCVIHAHAPNATILANAGIPFLPISSEAAFFGEIKSIPYMTPGSEELADALAEILKEDWAAFMVNHGVVCAGRSLRKACDMIQVIDRTAEVILGCYAVGKEPPLLPQDSIDKFRAIGEMIA